MKTKDLIGIRIKHLRQERGLSQEALSEKVGISPKYISSIERGKENPTLDIIIKLAGALQVDIEDIFKIAHEESNPKKLREMINHLLADAEEGKLQLVVKILKGVIR